MYQTHTKKNYKMTTTRQLRSQAFSYSQKDEGSWVEVGVKKNPFARSLFLAFFAARSLYSPIHTDRQPAQASSYAMAF